MGLSAADEYLLAALGFDWQTGGPAQEALVTAYCAAANTNDLYTQAQYDANGAAERTAGRDDVLNDPNSYGLYELGEVQAPRIDAPHLEAVAPGQFKLTIGVKKSTDLDNFFPFPMTAPETSINTEGKLEFLFTVPDDAAIFRLEAE